MCSSQKAISRQLSVTSRQPTSANGAAPAAHFHTRSRNSFAGHPVVGSWNALAREGIVPLPEGGNGWTRIHHEIGIGVLPVDIEFKDGAPVQVVMTQGKFEIKGEIDDPHEQAEIARALGLAIEDLDENLPIQVVSTGLPFLAVPIRSLANLRRCRVNAALLAEIYERAGSTGCYPFSRETIEIGEARAHMRDCLLRRQHFRRPGNRQRRRARWELTSCITARLMSRRATEDIDL